MGKAVRKTFKLLKKHSLKGLWVITGFCGLLAVLNLDISSQIDRSYQKNLSNLLYVSSPELSSVANVYANKKGYGSSSISLEKLLLTLKKKSVDEIFAVVAADELDQCQTWSKDIHNVTLILRDANLPEKCLPVFRAQKISYLSFIGDHKISDYLKSQKNRSQQEFKVDLGKGESVFVRNAQSYLYSQHSDTVTATEKLLNYPLAFSRILQIDAEDLLDETKRPVSLKGKTVFIGMNNSLADRPYSVLSEQISDDYYLSALVYNLKEKSFLKSAQSGFYYAFLALIFLQVFFAIQYCTQINGAFLIAGIALQTIIISMVSAVFLNVSMSFGHGLIAMVYATLHFQFSKRLEMEKVIQRTQKLLSARSLFNNQLLNNKKTYLDMSPNGQTKNVDSEDFDKYFTKLDVVDSVHGVVPQKSEQVNPVADTLKKAPASSLKMIKIEPLATPIKTTSEPTIRPKIFKTVDPIVHNPKGSIKKTALMNNDENNFKIKKPNVLIKKETDETSTKKHLFKIKKIVSEPAPAAEETQAATTPLIVSNFTKLFANNLKRKKITFSVKNEIALTSAEALNQTDKKLQIFFEALCLQVLSDVPPQTTIVFSSHKVGDFVVHLIKSESLKQFDYKHWIKNSKYFSVLADELKQKGIIIYQNKPCQDQNEIAVAVKKIKPKSSEAA